VPVRSPGARMGERARETVPLACFVSLTMLAARSLVHANLSGSGGDRYSRRRCALGRGAPGPKVSWEGRRRV